jgi:large subunit ribosomal protein L20
MTRVKRGTIHHKKRKHLIEYAKGFRWGRKSKLAAAKQGVYKAWSYAFRDRKTKKRNNRALWSIHINALSRQNGMTYSRLMGSLKKNNIIIDRKILSELSVSNTDVFKKIVEFAKG